MSQWQRAANYNYDVLISVSVGCALYEVCIGLHLINITNIWRVKGIILTLSYFLILFQFQFSAPLFFINNNNMLLSIYHTAHGHLLFIKLITLSGRVIIILYQYPSPSSFHQESDPVNNRCCRPQGSSAIRPIRVGLIQYPGVCISSWATFISATGEEGPKAGW